MSPTKCLARYGRRNSGLTTERIGTEIQIIISSRRDIIAVFGFGSFFRSQVYNDIDLLVVAAPHCEKPLDAYYGFCARALELGIRLGVLFDVTFLTSSEYNERPLREMDCLVALAGEASLLARLGCPI